MPLKIKLYLILVSAFLLMSFSYADLQLDKENQKKIEKAEKLNQDAQKLLDKANSIYSEVAEMAASGDEIDKIDKLQNKADELHIEALEKQKEANFLEYDVLKTILPDYKSKYSLDKEIPLELNLIEEEAKELFYKAEKLRNEAYKTEDGKLKLEKLIEAQEYELSGISKEKQLIDIYLGVQPFESKSSANEKQPKGDFVINEALLNSYINYVNSTDSIIPVEIFRQQLYSGTISSTEIRETWDEYLYEEAKPTEIVQEDIVDSEDHIAENIIDGDTQDEQIETGHKNEQEPVAEQVGEVNNYEKIEGVIYRVQIAADKKQLSQTTLQKIYAGNKKLTTINEDGWNKYSVGDFDEYKEADKFRVSLGESDAFVVAYKDGVKVDLLALLKENTEHPETKSTTEIVKSESFEGVIFRVQIAAAKARLSEGVLKSIYKGNEKINLTEEDNWYKYSIGSYKTYQQAIDLKNKADVNGAFVVAYEGNKKVSVKELLQKGNNDQEKIVFKIQIAADSKPLSSDKLHKIYSGYEKINKFEENGWHKYSIGEFNSFDEAKSFMETCGVKGAFIIAFKGESKMNVLDAKRSTRCLDPVINTDWIKNNTTKVYRVQIAASSKELSLNQIKRICCIEQTVYLAYEEGWYRYSIGNFTSFNDAVRLKKVSGVHDAFIVAYENGKRSIVK